MRIISYIVSGAFTISALALISGCKDSEVFDDGFRTTMVKPSDVKLDKVAYWPGDPVSCSFTLENETNYPIDIREVKVVIQNLDDGGCVLTEKSVASNLQIEPGKSTAIDAGVLYTLSETLKPSSFCSVKFLLDFEDGIANVIDGAYFRAINNQSLLTYDIQKSDYQGLSVYRQIGDMSAGFGVLKTMVAFDQGIAATMEEAPQGGTYPVAPTPEFLQRSVRKTVELYNSEIGASTKIKRVVIGTGIASVSYFATMMGAAYLPIHYLVSANSASEIQAILDYSNQNGYSSYATLGYDGSMPDVGVAWIKLLDLPEEYKQFITDHQVEEVYIYGVGQEGHGESYSRKVMTQDTPSEEYAPGSLYILYTNFGSDADIDALKHRLYDYNQLKLGEGQYISDWESGIVDDQITNISGSAQATANVKAYTIETDDMMALYNISSYLMLQYIKKNQSKLQAPFVNGIIFNEYLTNHPQYEAYVGYVPLLYWQFNPASSTIDRIDSYLKPATANYFPDVADNLYAGSFYLNANMRRYEFYDGLKAKGANAENIIIRQSLDKWNPADDGETEEYLGHINNKIGSAEEFAYDIIERIGVQNYRDAVKSMEYLTLEELRTICTQVGNMRLIEH